MSGSVRILTCPLHKRLKRALQDAKHAPPVPTVWHFYERHHPHSLWHGDCLEKVTLADVNRTAYQLTLMDDYSRAYVFYDLSLKAGLYTTIVAMIAALRHWQTIPRAVVFDNGSQCRGKLMTAFCQHLDIRLIYHGCPSSSDEWQAGARLPRRPAGLLPAV